MSFRNLDFISGLDPLLLEYILPHYPVPLWIVSYVQMTEQHGWVLTKDINDSKVIYSKYSKGDYTIDFEWTKSKKEIAIFVYDSMYDRSQDFLQRNNPKTFIMYAVDTKHYGPEYKHYEPEYISLEDLQFRLESIIKDVFF